MKGRSAVEYFLSLAEIAAKQSTCQRLAVGTVITSMDNYVISIGFNGTASGMVHCKDLKHVEAGKCPCTHSEINAIIHSNSDFRIPKKAFVTHCPCLQCMKALVTFGVKEVYYVDDYRLSKDTIDYCIKANVKLRIISR